MKDVNYACGCDFAGGNHDYVLCKILKDGDLELMDWGSSKLKLSFDGSVWDLEYDNEK